NVPSIHDDTQSTTDFARPLRLVLDDRPRRFGRTNLLWGYLPEGRMFGTCPPPHRINRLRRSAEETCINVSPIAFWFRFRTPLCALLDHGALKISHCFALFLRDHLHVISECGRRVGVSILNLVILVIPVRLK